MDTVKIHLKEVKETLLITLLARAVDSRRSRPLLGDRTAEDVVRRVDYDFARLKLTQGDSAAIVVRAKHLDDWTAEFLGANPDATVLHLGCGLDSRVFRIDPPPSVHWFDLDYPEVIALRRQLYPEREGYRTLGSSVTDFRWLDEVPADRPVLVVAEGLTPYLEEADVKGLLNRVTARFPRGEIAFDILSPLAGRAGERKPTLKATGATFHWLPSDLEQVGALDPHLRLVAEVPIVGSPYLARTPLVVRLMCRVMNLVPTLRDVMRVLRYRFDRSDGVS